MAKPGRREIETAGVPRRGMGCCAYDPRGNRPTAPVQRPLASAAASERNQSEQGWSQEKYRSRFGDVVLEFGTEIISLAFTITSAAQAQAHRPDRKIRLDTGTTTARGGKDFALVSTVLVNGAERKSAG